MQDELLSTVTLSLSSFNLSLQDQYSVKLRSNENKNIIDQVSWCNIKFSEVHWRKSMAIRNEKGYFELRTEGVIPVTYLFSNYSCRCDIMPWRVYTCRVTDMILFLSSRRYCGWRWSCWRNWNWQGKCKSQTESEL